MRRFAIFWLLCLVACDERKDKSEESPLVSAQSPTAPRATEESPAIRVRKLNTFAEAVSFAKPFMTDEHNSISPGTGVLGAWALKHMKLSDVLVAKDETSYALVQKDPDEARGKRFCYGGTVVQIAVVKTELGKGFEGLLVNRRGELFNFFAVGSTGELVQNSWGRICGAVIGKYDYSNSGGGTGHAVQLVGMFDLPENRTADPRFAVQQP